MGFQPFGRLGTPFVTADPRNITTSRTFKAEVYFEKDAVFSSGASAQAAARSANFSITNETGWGLFGDGTSYLFGDVTIGADLYSANWVPTPPSDLSSGPVVSATGYYLDHSAGAAQFQKVYAEGGELGTLDITGTLEVKDGAVLRTQTGSGDGYLELAGTSSNYIKFFTEHADETTPPSLWVTNWGVNGWSAILGAGQESPSSDQVTLTLASPSLASLFGYGAALATQYSDLQLTGYVDVNINAVTNDINLTANADINVSGSKMIFGGGMDLEMGANSYIKAYSGGDLVFANGAGTSVAYWNHASNAWIYNNAILVNNRIKTGGTTWTILPWSTSTIELGNYGSVGTQGSFATDLSWNFERNTSSGYTSKSVNSYTGAANIRLGSTGILFGVDSSFTAGSLPTTRIAITTAGALDFKGVVNITDDGVQRFGGDASYTNMHDPSGNKKFWVGTVNMYYNANTHHFRDSSSNLFVQFVDGTASTSVLKLRDGLTNVGNHETLRLNRGTGTTMQFVGYYSSYIKDPVTGETRKKKVVPLCLDHNRFWNRDWFMDLRPIKYDRVDGPQKPGYIQRELGFSIENLSKNTELLTTKGSQRGGSPDEYAILAVTVDFVQYQERQISALKCELQELRSMVQSLHEQLPTTR